MEPLLVIRKQQKNPSQETILTTETSYLHRRDLILSLGGSFAGHDSFAADQEIGWPIKVGTRVLAFTNLLK